MKSLRNKVQLIGNLGTDPEIKEFDNGSMLAKLVVATNDSYKNAKGEKIEETQWHNCVVWGKPAEIASKYLKKGSELCIEGKLTTRMWEDSDGNKRYTTEVVVKDFLMLGGK